MTCAKARKEAMRKMEASYAIYMANMGQPVKKPAATKEWTRYVMPWKWVVRREVAAL